MVTLREITAETVRAVTQLAVLPEQRRFVAANAASLAQALFSEEAWYRAIHTGDTLAGFHPTGRVDEGEVVLELHLARYAADAGAGSATAMEGNSS
ncbi:MAG: hypothetical protein ABI593_04355 [Betaproteobacteria bacterium]